MLTTSSKFAQSQCAERYIENVGRTSNGQPLHLRKLKLGFEIKIDLDPKYPHKEMMFILPKPAGRLGLCVLCIAESRG